eukprot:Gb_39070 [translate_table: standard]
MAPLAMTCVDAAVETPPLYGYGYGHGFVGGEASLPVSYFSTPNANANPNASSTSWSPALSSSLYKVDAWGVPYFVVNENGNLAVRPHGSASLSSEEIELTKVVKKVVEPRTVGGLGMSLPLIIRFPDVLKHRLEALQSAFDVAIGVQSYQSHFQGVYPVKCNQDRYIVENVVEFGKQYCFGLEAGSKPELLLAMSCLCKGSPKALLVCNGYKDEEYVSLALMSRRMDFNTVIVLEQEEEVDVVLNASRKLSIKPVIGIRAKLRTKHAGHFGGTSGEKGKFGLSSLEIVGVVRKMRKEGMLDCLQLLHFHIGSQIPSVDLLNDGVSEAAHIYCELVNMGANMRIIDIGGGLGIDYDGTKSSCSDMSVGYSLEEYAATVVKAVHMACTRKRINHPILCSESGRALVSHHSVLIFDVMSVQEKGAKVGSDFHLDVEGLPEELGGDYHALSASVGAGDYQKSLLYADQMKMRCVDLFKEGRLTLEQLATVDGMCELLAAVVARERHMASDGPSAIYHINLSIFKSVPDYWAIGQLFPIVPIHRLNERPTVPALLSDLTCDSDGKVETFIGGCKSLAMHSWEAANPYYLGLFLGGAYQEALGGLHNLFGSPNVVHVVQSSGPHCFAITRALPGQTSADVLRMMMHEPHIMFDSLKSRLEDSLGRYGHGGDEYDSDSPLNSIACSFDSLPYLSSSSHAHSHANPSPDDDDDEAWPVHLFPC